MFELALFAGGVLCTLFVVFLKHFKSFSLFCLKRVNVVMSFGNYFVVFAGRAVLCLVRSTVYIVAGCPNWVNCLSAL